MEQTGFNEDSERVPVEAEESFEHLLHEFCAHFGQNEATALEIMSFIDERRVFNDVSLQREADMKAFRKIKNAFACIADYQASRAFAFECAVYAFGFGYITGVRSMVEIAEKWKFSRENVKKLVHSIQAKCDLPPVPGQREEESRDNMADARREQLK